MGNKRRNKPWKSKYSTAASWWGLARQHGSPIEPSGGRLDNLEGHPTGSSIIIRIESTGASEKLYFRIVLDVLGRLHT